MSLLITKSIKKKKKFNGPLFPIVFFMGLIPFIVRLKPIKMDMSIYDWYDNTTQFYDFFAYYKAVFIFFTAFIAGITLLIHYVNKKYSNKKLKATCSFSLNYYYPLIAYFIFMLASWLFGPYVDIATFGYLERFEGGLILTSYLFLFLYITQTVVDEEALKKLTKWFIVSIIIMNLIGILQYIKIDYLNFDFFKKLILGKYASQAQLGKDVKEGRVYMTLYHPNYVGLYISMILPFAMTFFLCTRNWLKKGLWFILLVVLALNLHGSQSRGGLVGIGVTLFVALFILRKKIIENWYIIVPGILAACTVFYVADTKRDFFYSNRIKYTIQQTLADPLVYPVNSMETNEKSLRFDYKDNAIEFYYTDPLATDTYQFKVNGTNTPIVYNEETGKYGFTEAPVKELSFQILNYEDTSSYLNITIPTLRIKEWLFALKDEGILYRNPYNKEVKLSSVPTYGYKGKERIGSYRGYIWSRSNPMLLKNIFLGKGPDTFIFEFPQKDYIGKVNSYGVTNIIVDKPHNIYYQIALNTGLLSLIAMIAFWLVYIISSLRLYWKDPLNDFIPILGVALFLGICGYLGAGLFNDTSVSVSPIYWGMISMGYATNALYKNKKSSN